MQAYNQWVDQDGRLGQEPREVAEEGRVVKCPLRGVFEVPFSDREGFGDGEPVAVDLKIGRVVGGEEEELETCGECKELPFDRKEAKGG